MIALGLGLGIPYAASATSSGPTPAEQLATLLNGKGASAVWNPTDLSTLWTDNGTTQAAAGQLVYRADDITGNGYHLLQTTSGLRPAATDGLLFDTIDDVIVDATAATADMEFIIGAKRTSADAVGVFHSGTVAGAIAQDGSASTPQAGVTITTIQVNGTALSSFTRDVLYDAWTPDTFVRLDLLEASMPNLSSTKFGYLSATFPGFRNLTAAVRIDRSALTAGERTQARALAQQFVDEVNSLFF